MGQMSASRYRAVIVAPLAVATLLAALGAPVTEHYDWQELSRREAEIRAADDQVREGRALWTKLDEASYYAMTLAPFSDEYLVRRQPYAYRILAPLLAHLPVKAGLDFTVVYFAFASVGIALAGIFVGLLLLRLGFQVRVAVIGAVLFVLTTKVSNPLYAAAEIDPGCWALLFAAWYSLFAERSIRAALLVTLAVLWRETAILSLPAIALQAWVRPGIRTPRLAALVVLPICAFMAPRLFIESSNSLNLSALLDWTRMQAGGNPVSLATEYLFGLGLATVLLPFGFGAARRAGLWPMLLLLPTYMIASFPLEIGRLVVPASLASVVVAAYALDPLPKQAQRLLGGGLIAASGATLLAWRLESRAAWVLVGSALVVVAGSVSATRALRYSGSYRKPAGNGGA